MKMGSQCVLTCIIPIANDWALIFQSVAYKLQPKIDSSHMMNPRFEILHQVDIFLALGPKDMMPTTWQIVGWLLSNFTMQIFKKCGLKYNIISMRN